MWSKVDPPNAAQVRDAFGVEVNELQPALGGFEADGFTDGRWFVKSWREEPDSHRPLALTAELAARGIPVPAAQRALDGSYTSAHHGRRYALFPFVEGRQAMWNDDSEQRPHRPHRSGRSPTRLGSHDAGTARARRVRRRVRA